jgi:hypothetical protein
MSDRASISRSRRRDRVVECERPGNGGVPSHANRLPGEPGDRNPISRRRLTPDCRSPFAPSAPAELSDREWQRLCVRLSPGQLSFLLSWTGGYSPADAARQARTRFGSDPRRVWADIRRRLPPDLYARVAECVGAREAERRCHAMHAQIRDQLESGDTGEVDRGVRLARRVYRLGPR